VPHALALAEDKEMLCVADRENGRIQCFNCHNGSFIVQFTSSEMGSRIFSVAYSPAEGMDDNDLPVISVRALKRCH
jgi:NHL repeat.